MKTALLNKPFKSYEADIYYHIGLAYCNVEKYEKSIYPFTKVSSKNSFKILFNPFFLNSALMQSQMKSDIFMKERKLSKWSKTTWAQLPTLIK